MLRSSFTQVQQERIFLTYDDSRVSICRPRNYLTFFSEVQGQLGDQAASSTDDIGVMGQSYPNRLYSLIFKVPASYIDDALEGFLLPRQLNVTGHFIHFVVAIAPNNRLRPSYEGAQAPFNMPMEAHHAAMGILELRLCPQTAPKELFTPFSNMHAGYSSRLLQYCFGCPSKGPFRAGP